MAQNKACEFDFEKSEYKTISKNGFYFIFNVKNHIIAKHLLFRLLEINPKERITATEALHHPFLDGNPTDRRVDNENRFNCGPEEGHASIIKESIIKIE